ncbi:hypothetical protein ACN1C3_21510 [Pseudomonas sp. H11T01]|uniref:hypothetical protein n=1 Tax=Pseudomonas sp. H11T01 TaxID=3402749 RepID=UPI003AD4BE59
MTVRNRLEASSVWWIWGILDALSVAWYVVSSVRHNRVPYLTDMFDAFELLQDQGPVQAVIVAVSWALQLSIIVSALLFLTRRSEAKWLGFAQIPLRLIFLVPSISVVLLGAQIFPGYSPMLMMALIVGSEIVKGGTLWMSKGWAGRPEIASTHRPGRG